MNKVKRAVAKKQHSYVNDKGKRQYAQVGEIIEVTPEQALAFPDNLVAPEVLEATRIANKAVKDAEMKAREAKNAAKQSLDKIGGEAPEKEVKKSLKD